MALEAIVPDFDIDLSGLDNIDVRLACCGHTMRVHRERIGQTTPCVPCELRTGTFTLSLIEPIGKVPPPRRHYQPPTKRGFVDEFTIAPSIRKAWVKPQIDTRTEGEKIEDAERRAALEQARRERRRQEKIDKCLAFLRALVQQSDNGIVYRKDYDRSRGDLLTAEALSQAAGRSWTSLLTECGGKPPPKNHRVVKVTPASLAESVAFAKTFTASHGRPPTMVEWKNHRSGLPSAHVLVREGGHESWAAWLVAHGVADPEPTEADYLQALRDLAARMGATPHRREWDLNRPDGFLTFTALRRKFSVEVWREWTDKAGLPPTVHPGRYQPGENNVLRAREAA
jgi:hypothetical protein